jgi:hypothetical protein
MPKKEKTILVPMYLTAKQKAALDELWHRSRIQRSVLVREAIDDLLTKYKKGSGK